MVFAAAALVAEAGGVAGGRRAEQAREALRADDARGALERATATLAWDPWQIEAAYARCVALKRLGLWRQLDETIAVERRWHPDGTLLDLLAGEAAIRLERPADAAEALWRALRHNPRPRHDAARFWRAAMQTGEAAWGADDPRVAEAAGQVLELVDDDPMLGEAERAAFRREALRMLELP
jgi:hypothetical protein